MEQEKAKQETAQPGQVIGVSALSKEISHLKLVGISWSNNPDAMVEDTKALKTFFIKRGDMIGKFRVEAIFKDKIILSFEGEEVELR